MRAPLSSLNTIAVVWKALMPKRKGPLAPPPTQSRGKGPLAPPPTQSRKEICTMPALPLTTAIATYGHTRTLKDGTVHSERVVFKHVEVSPITSAFRRMVRGLDFDIAEMALSTYLCARAYQNPITALPIFLLRRFEHGSIVYNTNSGIQAPLDLHGRRVGVRSYTLTPGVWVRGILQDVYGVDLQQVQWVLFGDEHVAEYVAPAQVVPAPG